MRIIDPLTLDFIYRARSILSKISSIFLKLFFAESNIMIAILRNFLFTVFT